MTEQTAIEILRELYANRMDGNSMYIILRRKETMELIGKPEKERNGKCKTKNG